MKGINRLIRTIATTVVAGSLCIACASAALVGVGTVTGSGLRLRAEANTSSSILATASKNETVIVLNKTNNDWYQVSRGGKLGYMSASYLKVAAVKDASLGNGQVNANGSTLRLRSAANTGSSVLCSLPDHAVVTLCGVNNGWYKISYNGKTGYASGSYITPSSAAATTTASATTVKTQAGEKTTVPAATTSNSTAGNAIVACAKKYLGVRYVYGGSSPAGFDCSGFTQYVMKQCGYTIRRTASTQFKNNGTAVTRANLKPGDLVFFRAKGSAYAATHVGIYIGDGQFIHASTTGSTVRINSLDSKYYASIFVGGRRIAN
ncbi:MAG: C40 family peptidase [Oscillospiraceae bacterium]|nr:C40 family peptidase [Oscillospiraceae bacterium]